jgi:type I restriction enzyme S subunit
MIDIKDLITDNIDVWTSAIKKRNAVGRGSSKKIDLKGIKKLRELILELAVSGKLLQQDAKDEPASVLLGKIAEEKSQLIADKKIKKQKPLPVITDEEKLFECPNSWEFVRFIDVLDFSGGGQPPKSVFSEEKLEGYVQLIQIRDLGPNPQPVYIPKDRASKFCTENDVMVGRYGASVGKVFWGKEGAYNVALIRIHNDFNSYISGFIFQLLKSPLGQRLFTGISRSAQAGFNKDDIASSLLPLPPLAEQQRIVAKVDELMVLCDQLEQQTEQSLTAHQTLVEVLLAALTNCDSADDFQTRWQRIAEHFDVLFTTEHSIEQLKQTILQLAVMGKLVPQNPSDEPASVLLEKITEEKAQLIADKKIKKQKPLPAITDEEKPFELQHNWCWTLIDNAFSVTGGLQKTPKRTPVNNYYPYLAVANVQRGFLELQDLKYFEISNDELERYKLEVDDLMVVEGNGSENEIGRCAIWEGKVDNCLHQNHLIRCRPYSKKLSNWCLLTLNSPHGIKTMKSLAVTSSGLYNLSVGKIRAIYLPLPPIAEQQRIVAKVDELMALCEQLKARLSDTQTTQLHLADAVVEKALN